MYKNHNSLLHNIVVIALCYAYFLSNKHLFWEHSSVLPILFLKKGTLKKDSRRQQKHEH